MHLGGQALAAELNKRCGLTMRKTGDIRQTHFGLGLSPGGLSQALARVAEKLAPGFAELQTAVRASPASHADETSWWRGGTSAWLWVFTNPQLTLYTIDNRSAQVVCRVLGDDYCGVLVSDCLSSYDPHPGLKSKCCAHHLQAISPAQSQAADSPFLQDIRTALQAAMELHRLRRWFTAQRYRRPGASLQGQLDRLLARNYPHPAEQRIAHRLRKQRPHLLTFLTVAGGAPTNNLAERQLRPAVIARKLSWGNKTRCGAATFEALASLAATCSQQGRNFAEFVAAALGLAARPPPLLTTT